ncbi:MAG: dihydrolipoamide succinyltransferase [Caldithrix sp. RBG_13_44_9]|nr:MAG: dihydrolipoamide succinyltransferase [Caldithrix sp. RBG_13_44_9]
MIFEVKIPTVGESINEVTIGQWLKKSGDLVKMDEVLCEIESEKATLELRSEKTGLLKILVNSGETVPIGHKIAEIDLKEEIPVEASTKVEMKKVEKLTTGMTVEKITSPEKPLKISPVAARLLAESGREVSEVQGSGAGGRVTKADVQKFIQRQPEVTKVTASERQPAMEEKIQSPSAKKAEVSSLQFPITGSERKERRIKMSTLRKTIARRLVAAKNETAMLTTFNELDMSAIIDIRNRFKEPFQKKYSVKLGFMSFFIKACCIALREFPEVNAMVDEDDIVYHDFCDVAIAVSTPRGLVVPVIFNADRLNMPQLEMEVERLAAKARDNKLTIEEMTGGTFSITNGGVFGSLLSTPIINAPQTAILGMHKIQERPVAQSGQVVIRPTMYLALSYDHRIIDGKESVSFLVRLKELLEDPARMLLDA